MNCSPSGQAVLFSVGGSPAPIAEVKELRPIRAKVEGAIKYWDSVVLDERETPRLCRGDSQSLTTPGVA